MRISIKYKFLAVLIALSLPTLFIFFYYAQLTFSEDKRAFITDLNVATLRATISEVKLEIKTRIDTLRVTLPRVYQPGFTESPPENQKTVLYQGLNPALADEMVSITFYRKTASGYELARQYHNAELLEKWKVSADTPAQINAAQALPFSSFLESSGPLFLNRSLRLNGSNGSALGILTVMVAASWVAPDAKDMIASVDWANDFLRKRLQQSDYADLFFVFRDGRILAHPSIETTILYATKAYQHPLLAKLKWGVSPRDTVEVEIGNRRFLCNYMESGLRNILAVAQVPRELAFGALTILLQRTLFIGLIVIFGCLLAGVLFAGRLSSRLKKLGRAASAAGAGELGVRVDLRSGDELQTVAESLQSVFQRLREQAEAPPKPIVLTPEAKPEVKKPEKPDLAPARLIASVMQQAPRVTTEKVELALHNVAGNKLTGDFWDCGFKENTITLVIGSSETPGLPAAVLTGIAKTCFSTLGLIYGHQVLTPDQLLTTLNLILFEACQGKWRMTMSITQLSLESGELLYASAGHEAPLLIRASDVISGTENADKVPRAEIGVLDGQGERLGANSNARYESYRLQLVPGDTLLLYTGGVVRAKNDKGKGWGESSLKGALGISSNKTVAQLKKILVDMLSRYTAGKPQEDDFTFMLMSWKSSAGTSSNKTGSGSPPPPLKKAEGQTAEAFSDLKNSAPEGDKAGEPGNGSSSNEAA